MKLNNLQQAGVGLVLIVLAYVVMNFLILKDDKVTIDATKLQISELQQKINIAEAIKKNADALQKEMEVLREQLERLKKILPLDINKPKFMAEMKRYANENGIEIMKVSHNKSVQSDVIVEHPFTYHVKGNYHDFGNFFAQLTNYPRIVNVKGLNLVREGKDATYTVAGSFIISVYTYQEPSEEDLRKQIQEKRKQKQNQGNKA